MHRLLGAILLGLLGLLTIAAQEPNPLEPEILTRGPIHEAYATSPSAAPQPGPLAGKAPPELIEELPPEEKPDGEVAWIPGYWHWDEERGDYIWISGFWRVPPPGRQWVSGTWRQAGEAYQWTSGFWAGAEAQQIEYVPPPPAPLEITASTPAPGEDYLYAPGTWVYRDNRYAWRAGFWYAHRPNWVYIPAHYVWSPCGYVFVDGYWDYPLQRRGVLFAPVYFAPNVYVRPAFRYRPSYVLYDQALYGCLFVRPGFSAYYFGDYFDVRYTNVGYRSWFSVGVGVGTYDPLWGYYRRHYAATPGWSVGITTIYAGRYNNTVPRPPRTFVQQNTVVNNISKTTVINNTTINNVQNVTLAAPINKVDKTVVNLKPVSATEQQAAVKSAREIRNATTERVKLENQALAQAKTAPASKGGPPTQPIRVNLPPTPVRNTTTPQPAPPSPKDQPKAQTPPPLPKDQSKGATPPPLPKDQPKTTVPQPKEQPKGTTPPPLPKDAPKTPAPQPKETPKTPVPQPKEAPKTPAPQPKETPKTPPPQPKGPVTPAPQPKAPAPPPTPAPQPKSPPPPLPKNPAPKDAPKGKGKNDPPAQVNIAPPRNPAPRVVTPSAPPANVAPRPAAPAPKVTTPPRQQPPAPKSNDRPKSGNEKKGDRPT